MISSTQLHKQEIVHNNALAEQLICEHKNQGLQELLCGKYFVDQLALIRDMPKSLLDYLSNNVHKISDWQEKRSWLQQHAAGSAVVLLIYHDYLQDRYMVNVVAAVTNDVSVGFRLTFAETAAMSMA